MDERMMADELAAAAKRGQFLDVVRSYADFDCDAFLQGVQPADVERVLAKPVLNREDYLTLLSPCTAQYLEPMAQRAHRESVRNFGYVMQLFTPMYIANYCENGCVYCGFHQGEKIVRRQLDMEEIRAWGRHIKETTGLESVLVLTGESPKFSSPEYIREAVAVLRDIFASVSLEVYSLTEADYRQMVEAGADGMTMFQECYDEEAYAPLHPFGPKSNYAFRLDAPERAARAGMRTIGLGALLGLTNWRREAFFTGIHADYLQHKYKDIEVAISTPRLRPCVAGFQARSPIDDTGLVQYILAFRLFMPRAGITVSTRESREMRNHLVYLGVTKMSGSSSTAVGGLEAEKDEESQFDINDTRTAAEMAQMLYDEGYQPVYQDWQPLTRAMP